MYNPMAERRLSGCPGKFPYPIFGLSPDSESDRVMLLFLYGMKPNRTTVKPKRANSPKPQQTIPVAFSEAKRESIPIHVSAGSPTQDPFAIMDPFPYPELRPQSRPVARGGARNFTLIQIARKHDFRVHSFQRKLAVADQASVPLELKLYPKN